MKSWSVFEELVRLILYQTEMVNSEKRVDLEIDLSSVGLGKRLSRFAMLIDSG